MATLVAMQREVYMRRALIGRFLPRLGAARQAVAALFFVPAAESPVEVAVRLNPSPACAYALGMPKVPETATKMSRAHVLSRQNWPFFAGALVRRQGVTYFGVALIRAFPP